MSRPRPRPRRPRTILFLIADTGAGHRSAANAINHAMHLVRQQQQEQRQVHPATSRYADPGWRTLIVDAFADCSRFPLRNGVFLYGPAIKYSPRLYGQAFRMTNTAGRFNTALRLCQPFLSQGLRELLERTQPDVIVSVHPLLNHVTLKVLREAGLRIPFLTVITDLVSIHWAWIAPDATACIVPTEAARDFALAAGMPAKRIRLLGMPIDPKFAHPPRGTIERRRAALGLDPSLPAVLLIGGGEGAGGLAEAVAALHREQLPAQLVVITGRNRQLYDELERQRRRFQMPLHPERFVSNMPEFMWAADVVVTKAGPGTISEAVACELPIILTGAVPGQEEGNIDYVLDNGLGTLATTPADLVATLRDLLAPESQHLAQWREHARQLRHANASLDIARLILSYLPAPSARSVWETRPHRVHARRSPLLVKIPRDLMPRFALMRATEDTQRHRAPSGKRGASAVHHTLPAHLIGGRRGSVSHYRILARENLRRMRVRWKEGGARGEV